MKFIRKSLTNKALLIFTLLVVLILSFVISFKRMEIESISVNVFLIAILAILLFILIAFILDVIVPLNRVVKQITNLLTGKNYKKIEPTTIDEVGIMTHFFNEITHDLEKISYDLKDRRRMSSELDIASQIQRDVLPKTAPLSPGLDIIAKTRSAAEIGGDTFNFLLSPDNKQLFIYIGDVTGHGVPAGLIMMMVDMLVNSMVSIGIDNSKDLVVNTNKLLTPRISSRLFMTSVVLRWDIENQKLFYTGAGHEHILIYRKKTDSVEAIRSGGIALGMIPDASKIAKENEIPLEIGDTIVLYTDGITEAKNKTGQMFEISRLQESLGRHGYKPSSESVLDGLTLDFSNFVGEYIQIDDITMIVIKYLGKDSEVTSAKLTISTENSNTSQINKKWSWN